jgi:hypothetical protein
VRTAEGKEGGLTAEAASSLGVKWNGEEESRRRTRGGERKADARGRAHGRRGKSRTNFCLHFILFRSI